jgi:Uma2 family endonuclease
MAYFTKTRHKKRSPAEPHHSGLTTFQKFYDTVDEKTKADLLDGMIIRDSPAIPRHGLTVSWVNALLTTFTQQLDLGYVLGATSTVRLTIYNSPEPDIFFISKHRASIIVDRYVDGPPDLCVEVISRSSRKYDRGRKFVLYAEHGVREYWIIDPLRDTVEFFENRGGELVPIQPDDQGRLHSKVLPGFWLKPEWLTASPLPPILAVLKEILGSEQRL